MTILWVVAVARVRDNADKRVISCDCHLFPTDEQKDEFLTTLKASGEVGADIGYSAKRFAVVGSVS